MKFRITKKYAKKLTDYFSFEENEIEELEKKLSFFFGENVEIKSLEDNPYLKNSYNIRAQDILIDENNIVYRAIIPTKEQGRNTFLAQPIEPLVRNVPTDKIKMVFFDKYPKISKLEDSVLRTYKIIELLGIEIINKAKKFKNSILKSKYKRFNSVEDILFEIVEYKKRNNKKSPDIMYLGGELKRIMLVGKFSGATERDISLTLHGLDKLNSLESDEDIMTFSIAAESFSSKNVFKTLIKLNSVIDIDSSDEDLSKQPLFKHRNIEHKKNIRDQSKFISNLLKIYQKECILCGCPYSDMLIASHIERVADINKKDISYEEKIKNVTSENNGFFLCRNHDILFEKGIIYLSEDKKWNISKNIGNDFKDYIYHNNIYMKWDASDIIPDSSIKYIKKHLERTNNV